MENVKDTVVKKFGHYPEKVLQFGEGNFLRAFADWMIDLANEKELFHGSIVLCQPIAKGNTNLINKQNGIYTVSMRGIENGKVVEKFRKITSISRCINPYEDYDALLELAKNPDLEVIISNTTEAGIAYHAGDKLEDRPASSYPAKLCAFLYARFTAFNGDKDKGFLILPVELIENNGANLKRIVLQYAQEWKLGATFSTWIETCNEFTSTLVDRIVTGFPRDNINEFQLKLGYEDQLLVICELFNLWVIQGNEMWTNKLPIHKTEADVFWTTDVAPYKKRKVRILNGSHTAVVPLALLAGYETVLDFFTGSLFGDFERQLIDEEIISVVDLPKDDLVSFSKSACIRFSNPHIKHRLIDITLNNCSKFAARCLPTIIEYYEANHALPPKFVFALAGFIRFYNVAEVDGQWTGHRDNGDAFLVKDDADALSFMHNTWCKKDHSQIVHDVLSHTAFWNGKDLTKMVGLVKSVLIDLEEILAKGVHEAMIQRFYKDAH